MSTKTHVNSFYFRATGAQTQSKIYRSTQLSRPLDRYVMDVTHILECHVNRTSKVLYWICWNIILLYYFIMLFYYIILLYYFIILFYYVILLYYFIMLFYYIILLYYFIILFYYIILLCYFITLFYYIILLYYFIILLYYIIFKLIKNHRNWFFFRRPKKIERKLDESIITTKMYFFDQTKSFNIK